MIRFPEIPRKRTSRKKIYGEGVNDSAYMVYVTIGGKRICCPYYGVWISMLARCYSHKYQARQPTYIGCEVDPEWLKFSNFKAWMQAQDWQGKELDKDILEAGNKIYAPDKCVFVSRYLNTLFQDQLIKKGDCLIGVERLPNGKYRPRVTSHGKQVHLGIFSTEIKAHQAYADVKVRDLFSAANEQTDLRIRDGFLNRAFKLNRSAHL